MTSTERLERSVTRLRALVGERDASICAGALADDALLAGLAEVTEARAMLDLLEAAFSAEVEKRSDRSFGYAGLAQRKGHRNGTALVQHVTGKSRPEVERATRAGRDLAAVLEAPSIEGEGGANADAGGVDADALGRASVAAWFSPLTSALQSGALSRDQYDAIRRNLGEPPTGGYPELAADMLQRAWREAAIDLIEEARDRPAEDLRAAARLARDTLDPIGTQLRFEERFANRSLPKRAWIGCATTRTAESATSKRPGRRSPALWSRHTSATPRRRSSRSMRTATLNVGREKRLFIKKQRDAMTIWDGGCLRCGAEPSRCEAHHIDHWWEHLGRTDIADGVLLCRNCHMRLHNQRWRITRDKRGTYWLNAPPGAGGDPSAPPRMLRPRSLLRLARSA